MRDDRNNFALIRLLAALQIAVHHAIEHLHLGDGSFLTYFPGVPVFFVMSGYLVSYRGDLRAYVLSRALRIYPGLWGCLLVTAVVASIAVPVSAEFVPWLIAQATVVQFYNPEFLRGFGVGVINGSVWTIPVILQFYALLPMLSRLSNRALFLTLAAAMLASQIYTGDETLAMKLIGVSIIPYLYMFMLGMVLKRYQIKGNLLVMLTAYVGASLALNSLGVDVTGNTLNPLSASLLAMIVVSAAHTRPIHIKHDLSYGIYLYHMLAINIAVYFGETNWLVAIACIGAAMSSAYVSLVLIERPALRLRHSNHDHAPVAVQAANGYAGRSRRRIICSILKL